MTFRSTLVVALATPLLAGGALAGPGAPGHAHSHRTFAAGAPGDPARPARTVTVEMQELPNGTMAFAPERIDVKRGEQVRFVLKNVGTEPHEFLLDTPARNAKHKAAMAKHPDMEHDDPNGRRLAAGKTESILWRFTKRGTFEYACLIPGHYEFGMYGTVVVK